MKWVSIEKAHTCTQRDRYVLLLSYTLYDGPSILTPVYIYSTMAKPRCMFVCWFIYKVVTIHVNHTNKSINYMLPRGCFIAIHCTSYRLLSFGSRWLGKCTKHLPRNLDTTLDLKIPSSIFHPDNCKDFMSIYTNG